MINTSSSVKPRVVIFHIPLTIDSNRRISLRRKSHAKRHGKRK
jgi:hypothetical protein